MKKEILPIQFSEIKIVKIENFKKQIPKIKLIDLSKKGFSKYRITSFYKPISKII